MANTFKNYTSSGVGTGAITVYTVPSATSSVVIGCSLANVTASQVTVDVQTAGVYLVKGVPVPAHSALSIVDGKIVLEAADTLIITSNTASSVDAIVSVLEQT